MIDSAVLFCESCENLWSAKRPDGGLALCPQEYFVDDLCELMLYVGQHSPKLLEGLQVEEIMTFMVVFMGSPACLKNPFVRSRISEVRVTALMQVLMNCMLSSRNCLGDLVSDNAQVKQIGSASCLTTSCLMDPLLDGPLLDDPVFSQPLLDKHPGTLLDRPLPPYLTTLGGLQHPRGLCFSVPADIAFRMGDHSDITYTTPLEAKRIASSNPKRKLLRVNSVCLWHMIGMPCHTQSIVLKACRVSVNC